MTYRLTAKRKAEIVEGVLVMQPTLQHCQALLRTVLNQEEK